MNNPRAISIRRAILAITDAEVYRVTFEGKEVFTILQHGEQWAVVNDCNNVVDLFKTLGRAKTAARRYLGGNSGNGGL